MTKYLVYIHPAVPSCNIKINTWYSLEELQERFDLDYIKSFFTPANFAWEDLEVTTNKKLTK